MSSMQKRRCFLLCASQVLDAKACGGGGKKMFGEITILSRKGQPEDEIAFLTPEDVERTRIGRYACKIPIHCGRHHPGIDPQAGLLILTVRL